MFFLYFYIYGLGGLAVVLLVYDVYRELHGIPTGGRIKSSIMAELDFHFVHYHQNVNSSGNGTGYVAQTQGHFQCKLTNGKEVSFYLGSDINTDVRCNRLLQVLEYYGILCVMKEREYE